MPRTTKDSEKEELNKKKTSTKKSTAKKATSLKPVDKTAKTDEGKNKTKKISTTVKKTSRTKSTSTAKKSVTSRKKASTSSTNKKSSTASKKKTTSSARKKISNKKIEESIVAEYYDLPYRYNETVVKILYQTPTILFVYWDISDYDRENYIKQYGENFFNNTKPILKIYNLTKNYSFEVEINDFANSWYVHVNDANCIYRVELSRKKIDYIENLHLDYVYISSSNDIESPNDHILLEELPNRINFKNVKTNSISAKDTSTLHLIGINKIYNVYDFYKTFYKDEIEGISTNATITTSSSSWK